MPFNDIKNHIYMKKKKTILSNKDLKCIKSDIFLFVSRKDLTTKEISKDSYL